MQPPIGQAAPSARPGCVLTQRRIGGDACDLQVGKCTIGLRREPACVARFAGNQGRGAGLKLDKELPRDAGVVAELRGQLDEEHGKLLAKDVSLSEEVGQQISAIDQLCLMRDRLWELGRESEASRYAVAPPLPGRETVLPVEGAVDLGGGEALGITFEGSSFGRKKLRDITGYGPAGRSDSHPRQTKSASVCSGGRSNCSWSPSTYFTDLASASGSAPSRVATNTAAIARPWGPFLPHECGRRRSRSYDR